MTDNNNYWQFQQSMVDAPPMMLPHQQQQPTQPPPPLPPQQQQPLHQQQQQQQMYEDSEKTKWNQSFSDFDMNSHANKMFHMDDYSNHEPSEGDSPDSGGGGSSKRNELLSDPSMFQGGDQKQRRKEQNRAAQRAFRERKERYVKELQIKIREMEKKHDEELSRVVKENESLKALVKKMEAEIYTLKGAAIAFDVSIHKLREAGLDVKPHIRNEQPSTSSSSPPTNQSDRQSPVRMDDRSSSAIATIRDERYQSGTMRDPLFDSFNSQQQQQRKKSVIFTHKDHTMSTDEENEQDHEASFAERETSRFEHQVDPIVYSGVKLIPCSQIWERLSQHPHFDEFDMDRLCEELKKKARCSGTGPVIPESELQEVLHRMDIGIA